MPVPDCQSLMLPILKFAGDGREHTTKEAAEVLARELDLTEEEKLERVAPGKPSLLRNRVAWATVYLRRAGLLESAGRAAFRITARGTGVLTDSPPGLTVKYLMMQFPDFQVLPTSLSGQETAPQPKEPTAQTPEEILESSYQLLRHQLASDLLERVRGCTPGFFESLVLDLLVAMGYGGSREDAARVGRSGDGGIDGIIKEDKLGLDAVYVQAKRWQGTVGSPAVQGFAGSLEAHKANKGVLITTSTFSKDAQEFVGRLGKRIVLLDGEKLAELMIDHGVGVTDVAAYTVKRVDSDYFEED